REQQPFFASRLLEGLLRPILDDLGSVVRSLLERFGLGGGQRLERKLAIVRPGVEATQFFGEKLTAGLVGLGVFPLMNGIGVHPFGVWPIWAWAAGFVVGFLGPDWELEHRLARRRTMVVMELPI